jgi:glycosyltransferase involved in cell wall biosynthesis
MEAWPKLPGERVQGVMFGAGEAPTLEAGQAPIGQQAPIRHLGFVRDPERLRLIYSAADMFVLPSLEDNLPQTGMEAMSCGTPVVAFAAGGIPDYVRPEQTGLLAPVGDSESLARQLRRLVETPELAGRLGANARKMMLAEFQQPIESARYLELLDSILAARRSASRAA